VYLAPPVQREAGDLSGVARKDPVFPPGTWLRSSKRERNAEGRPGGFSSTIC